MGKVLLQSQEWRTVQDGVETFGETLFIDGIPIDKEEYGEATVVIASRVIKAMGKGYEILTDLDSYDMGEELIQDVV